MKKLRHSRIASWLIIFSMILSLSTGILVGGRASAHTYEGQPALPDSTQPTTAYPALSRYATDLTSEAEAGRLEKVVGRDAEINRAVEILGQQTGKNPVLMAESGPLTAQIADGIAAKIAQGDVPENLRGARLFSLNIEALSSHVSNADDFKARLQSVLSDGERADGKVILFVDQLHQYVGSFAMRAANDCVRDALVKGNLRILGASSANAYAEYIGRDQTLSPLFQQVDVTKAANDSTDDSKDTKDESKDESASNNLPGAKISPDLQELMQQAGHNGRVTLILQADDIRSGKYNALLKANGVKVQESYANL